MMEPSTIASFWDSKNVANSGALVRNGFQDMVDMPTWTIVAAIGFSENCEVAVLVLGKV